MTAKEKSFIVDMMEQHEQFLYQVAYRRLGDRELAKDMVQETFLTLTAKVDQVIVHKNPAGWLFKTLSYLICREQERACHYYEMPLSEQDGQPVVPTMPLADILPGGLREEDQELLILRFEEQLDYRQIAEKKGIKEAACRQRVSRAIRRCRELMELEAK